MKEKLNDEEKEVEVYKDEDIQKKEKEKKKLIYGIRNLIANEINFLGTASLMGLVSLGVYRISYLRHFQKEKTLDLQHSYFFGIIFRITSTFTNLFAAGLERKLGLRGVIIIGTIIRLISNLITFFSKSFYLDLLGMFVLALGLFPLMLLGRNFMYFFFEIRGKLSGALGIVNAIESSGFSLITEKFVVNPESDEADVDEQFFTYNISKRVLNYIILNIIISVVTTVLILIIIVPYNKEKHGKGLSFSSKNKKFIPKEGENKKDIDKEFNINNTNSLSINNEEEEKEKEIDKEENNKVDEGNEGNKEDEQNGKKKKKPLFAAKFLKKALKSRRIIFLSLIQIFSSPLGAFFHSQWRNIAIRNNIPTSYQQNILAITPFVNCFSKLIFGWLSDSFSFKYLNSILSFIQTFISILYCFTFQNPFLYSIIILVHTLVGSGLMSIGAPHFMKVFGLKHFIEISSLIGLPSTILNPILTVFMFFFDQKYKNYTFPEKFNQIFTSPYFILYAILGLLNAIAAVLSCFESEELLEL